MTAAASAAPRRPRVRVVRTLRAAIAPPRRRSFVAFALAALAPCVALAQAQMHSALEPQGPQAGHIHALWLLLLGVCALVLVAVTLAVLAALRRAPRGDAATPGDAEALMRDEAPLRRSVGTALAVSVALLVVLFVAAVLTERALARLPLEDAVHVKLTGHQWWWEATYDDPQPSNVFSTANELHIPVGRPVLLTLDAGDVIHSVWLPNLAGKKDLIPGRTATLALRADAPGVYRGPCAEFCGYQHAKMTLLVVADPPERYAQWIEHSRGSAPAPSDEQARHGQQVFLRSTCAMCHAIQGTPANAKQAPDLTHLASRRTLAAGTLPNTRENLAAWISDPQAIKPGCSMPGNALSPADLQALVAYLETLR